MARVFIIAVMLLCIINPTNADDSKKDTKTENIELIPNIETTNEYPLDFANLIRSNNSFLTTFRPMYAGYSLSSDRGKSDHEVKFQISFKYNIGKKIFLGYTQKSIWSINSKSSPIKETDYSPELFYIHNNKNSSDSKSSWLPYEFMLTGFRHESNGKTGAESYGWNMLYIEPHFALSQNKNLMISPSLWYPFTSSHNKVLTDNIGIGKLSVEWQPNDLFLVSSSFSHGLKRNTYGIEGKIDHFLRHNKYWFNPSLFVQVWNGYGEMLGTNAINTTRIIIGFSASR